MVDHFVSNTRNMIDIVNDTTNMIEVLNNTTNIIDVVSTNMTDIVNDTINMIDFDKISFDLAIIPNLFLILFFLIYKWNSF